MVQNLSALAADSLAVSAMSGGNTVSSNAAAMTAPGSPPVDRMPPEDEQPDPALTLTDKPLSVAVSPPAYTPGPVAWKLLPENGYTEGAR